MNEIQGHLREIWWLLLLRGFALIIFGIVAIMWPGITLAVLSGAFAGYLLVAGVVDTIVGIRAQGRRSLWFLTLILGLAEIGAAVYLLKTGLAVAAFIAFVGLSLIIMGIVEIMAAFEAGEDSSRRFLLIISGALGVIAGFITIRYPESSGLAFTWALGVWGLLAGAIQIAMCLGVRADLDKVIRHANA